MSVAESPSSGMGGGGRSGEQEGHFASLQQSRGDGTHYSQCGSFKFQRSKSYEFQAFLITKMKFSLCRLYFLVLWDHIFHCGTLKKEGS